MAGIITTRPITTLRTSVPALCDDVCHTICSYNVIGDKARSLRNMFLDYFRNTQFDPEIKVSDVSLIMCDIDIIPSLQRFYTTNYFLSYICEIVYKELVNRSSSFEEHLSFKTFAYIANLFWIHFHLNRLNMHTSKFYLLTQLLEGVYLPERIIQYIEDFRILKQGEHFCEALQFEFEFHSCTVKDVLPRILNGPYTLESLFIVEEDQYRIDEEEILHYKEIMSYFSTRRRAPLCINLKRSRNMDRCIHLREEIEAEIMASKSETHKHNICYVSGIKYMIEDIYFQSYFKNFA